MDRLALLGTEKLLEVIGGRHVAPRWHQGGRAFDFGVLVEGGQRFSDKSHQLLKFLPRVRRALNLGGCLGRRGLLGKKGAQLANFRRRGRHSLLRIEKCVKTKMSWEEGDNKKPKGSVLARFRFDQAQPNALELLERVKRNMPKEHGEQVDRFMGVWTFGDDGTEDNTHVFCAVVPPDAFSALKKAVEALGGRVTSTQEGTTVRRALGHEDWV